MCCNARENDVSVYRPQSVCGKPYTIYVYEQKGKAMKKITKIISFCAAVTMAATAVPASSLLMAQAADVAKITVGKDAQRICQVGSPIPFLTFGVSILQSLVTERKQI